MGTFLGGLVYLRVIVFEDLYWGRPFFWELPKVLRVIVLVVQPVTGWGQYPIHIALV